MGEELRYDTVVVGAGLIGLSSAYFLSKRGFKTLVIEKGGTVGCECSFGSAATTWPFLIRSREPKLYTMVEEGIKSHLELSECLKYDYVQKNCIWLLESENLRESAERFLANDTSWEQVSKSQVAEMEPCVAEESIVGGILIPRVYQGESLMLCNELAKHIESSGSEIATSSEAMGFEFVTNCGGGENSIAGVRLNNGKRVRADSFVISAGAWSQSFTNNLRYSVPTMPVKGHIIDYRNSGCSISNLLFTGRIFVRNTRDGIIRVGSNRDYSGFDKTVNENATQSMHNAAERFIPSLKKTTSSPTVWTGLRPGTPDGMPLIGYAKQYKNLIIATGHFHEGFTLAAYTGEVVSNLISNRDLEWPFKELCNPDRFNDADFRP